MINNNDDEITEIFKYFRSYDYLGGLSKHLQYLDYLITETIPYDVILKFNMLVAAEK